ncbi:hypothetical protein HYV72_01180 [Candidatus Uhrbacteria bacterium]|nr:hypothetical protein [Candidatus Uhrbacteria bacterium]
MTRAKIGWLAVGFIAVAFIAGIVGANVARRSVNEYAEALRRIPESFEGLSRASTPDLFEGVDRARESRKSVTAVVSRADEHARTVFASAILMTSDGWALVPRSVATTAYGLVLESRVAPIQSARVIPGTNLAFVRVEGRGGSVVTFGESEALKDGDLVMVAGVDGLFPRFVSSVRPLELAPDVESSDTLWRRFRLDQCRIV